MSTAYKKAQIRDVIRSRRQSLEPADVKYYGEVLAEQIIGVKDKEFKNIINSAKTIAVYSAVNGELPCDGVAEYFAKNNKAICYPKVNGGTMDFYEITDKKAQMVKGAYGILEPDGTTAIVKPEDIDIMIVPAIAYNDEGLRLGQGGGYYDKYLALAMGKGKVPYTIGVCYDFQIYSALPVEAHDLAVDCIMCVYTGDDE